MKSLISQEYRCSCGKLLFKGMAFTSTIEIKCRSCGQINKISGILGDAIEERQNCFTYLLNRDGIIKDISESVEDILGYCVKEVIGKSIFEFSKKTDKEAFTRLYDSLVNTNSDVFCQVRPVYQSKSGEYLSFKVSFRVFKSGDEKLLFCVADLASDGCEYHSEEIDSAKKVDTLCDGYCELAPDMTITAIGSRVGDFLGYSEGEVLGRKMFELLSPKEDQVVQEGHVEAIKNHNFLRMLGIKMKMKDGQVKELDLYFTPNFNDVGQYVGYKMMGWFSKKQ
jgi:PAS domain S-box-containing protein